MYRVFNLKMPSGMHVIVKDVSVITLKKKKSVTRMTASILK